MANDIFKAFNEAKPYITKQVVKWVEIALGERDLKMEEAAGSRVLTDLDGNEITAIVGQLDWTDLDENINSIFQKRFPQIFEATANVEAAALKSSFNLLNPRAVNWLRDNAAKKVVEIGWNTKLALNNILVEYYNDGKTVGQMGREIRKHIGLHNKWSKAVENKKAKLIAGGMGRSAAEAKANQYAKKLLRLRADTIARTETTNASNAGQLELWEQAGYQDQQKTWILTPDDRLCDDCAAMEGQTVKMNENFYSTTLGVSVSHPGLHTSCRCSMKITFVNKKAEPKQFKNIREWQKSLTPDQKEAFKKYTGMYYSNIRKFQKTGEGAAEVIKWTKDLEEAFKTAPRWTQKSYRGIGNLKPNILKNITGNETMTFDSFTSTSRSFYRAKGFANLNKSAKNSVVFEIEGKTGVNIEDLSKFRKEEEILFHKTKFKVGAIEFIEDEGYYLVKLKEVS